MNLILSLLLAVFAFAAPKQYQVESKVYVEGKLVASRTAVLPSGKSDDFSQKGESGELKLKLTAATEKKNAVRLDYALDFSSGQKKIKASPRIIALVGEKAVLTMGPDGKEEIKVEALVRDLSEISQIVPTMEKDLGEELASFASESDTYLEDLEIMEEK